MAKLPGAAHQESPAHQSARNPILVTLDGRRVALVEVTDPEPRASGGTLTEAERCVAAMSVRGLSSAEIARSRGTSLKTVSNQLESIYRKVGVRSRSELARSIARGDRPLSGGDGLGQ